MFAAEAAAHCPHSIPYPAPARALALTPKRLPQRQPEPEPEPGPKPCTVDPSPHPTPIPTLTLPLPLPLPFDPIPLTPTLTPLLSPLPLTPTPYPYPLPLPLPLTDPVRTPDKLLVGATTEGGSKSSFSSYGACVHMQVPFPTPPTLRTAPATRCHHPRHADVAHAVHMLATPRGRPTSACPARATRVRPRPLADPPSHPRA